MDCPEKLTVASFCTGYGGIERGLGIAGIQHRVVVNVEIETFAVALLVKAMEEGSMDPAPIWTDLKIFPSESFCGKVDIISAGYPCQPFSVAGNGLGEDDPRHLWPFILRHVKAIKPRWVFLENVRGHVKNGLREVLADLGKAGYRTDWGIFSAEEVGAPHRRERVFILADSNGFGLQGVGENCNQEGWKRPEERPVGLCDRTIRRSDWEVEPELGRVADGTSYELDIIKRLGGVDEEGNLEEKNTTVGELSREILRRVWENRDLAETSPGLYVRKLRDSMPEMPCGGPQGRWYMGERLSKDPALCDMWEAAYEEQNKDLFPELFIRAGKVKCREAMERVDRLRILGNGVVPQTAALAWQVLSEKLG